MVKLQESTPELCDGGKVQSFSLALDDGHFPWALKGRLCSHLSARAFQGVALNGETEHHFYRARKASELHC